MSAKTRARIEELLEDGPFTSTGGRGRLVGKLAAKLNAGTAEVSAILGDKRKFKLGCNSQGLWYAKLR